LRRAHLAVGVRRRAIAHDPRECDAVEVQDAGGDIGRGDRLGRGGGFVRAVFMVLGNSWVFVGLFPGRSLYRQLLDIAQRRRGVVVIRGPHDDSVARGRFLPAGDTDGGRGEPPTTLRSRG
jgi:hypothetical protein